MEKMKLSLIGAGSTYTPQFGEVLAKTSSQIPVEELVLMDVDAERLEIVAGFTKFWMKENGKEIKIKTTTDLHEATHNADFVITTMRVGGARGRVLDEEIPQKHGLVGQETIPPGGLLMGLRNIPVIISVAKSVEENAKPNAWLINLANPGGMLTEAIYQKTKCKAVGLCNWPTNLWQSSCIAYGVPKERVFLKFIGLNHLNWAEVFVDGKDVGHEAREKIINEISELANIGNFLKICMPEEIMNFINWTYMSYYLRYHYSYDETVEGEGYHKNLWRARREKFVGEIPNSVLNKLDNAKNRGEQIIAQEEYILDCFRRLDKKGFLMMKGTRGGGAGYAEAGLDVVRAMVNNTSEIQIVDYPNLGTIQGIEYENVAEMPCVINKVGVFPLSLGKIPRHMTSIIQANKHYEILAIEAATNGDYKAALESLLVSPMIHSFHKARVVLDELLVAHENFLPNFKESIEKIKQGIPTY